MNEPSELSIQLALARELPELIDADHALSGFYWKQPYQFVTPREWLWIMAEVEKKLRTESSRGDYVGFLGIEVDVENRRRKRVGRDHNYEIVSAPWQARAIAYFRTIGKEIE